MTRGAAAEPGLVLVITVWREAGSPHPLRARVTYGRAMDEVPTTLVTTDPDEVIDTVRHWLADVVDANKS